jgi:hypothetical protein
VQVIDQAGPQVLPNCRDATADLDVACSRDITGAFQGGVDPVRHEVERRAALHHDRLASMVRQNVGRRMKGRIFSPPAPPAIVLPFFAHWAEHVAAEDEGAEAVHLTVGKAIVQALRATALAYHGLECPRSNQPAVKFLATLPQRILETLFRARPEPVQRHGKSRSPDTSHLNLPLWLPACCLVELMPAIRKQTRGIERRQSGRNQSDLFAVVADHAHSDVADAKRYSTYPSEIGWKENGSHYADEQSSEHYPSLPCEWEGQQAACGARDEPARLTDCNIQAH